MGEDDSKIIGRMEGKLDMLIESFVSHERRHEIIDEKLGSLEGDINQAKGAKGILVIIAGAAGAMATALWHSIDKILR